MQYRTLGADLTVSALDAALDTIPMSEVFSGSRIVEAKERR